MIWRCDLVPQYQKFKSEIDTAINRVLNSGVYVLGKEVKEFEEMFAKYLGVKHVIGVANGTDALILSLKVLGIEKGDEVITSPFTAIPTVSAIVAVGAIPVFVDIDPNTWLIDIKGIKNSITKKTKAIMPVHMFGNVVNIEAIKSNFDIPIIEDTCQAHGSRIDGKLSGSMGSLSAFSFYPTKNIGGYGDGGAIATNDDEFANILRQIRMYGMIDKDHIVTDGVNSRLDEVQAAILKIKLNYLETSNNARRSIFNKYKKEVKQGLFKYQTIDDNVKSNFHVFNVEFLKNRAQFIKYMEEYEIQTNIYYQVPVYKQLPILKYSKKGMNLVHVDKVCSRSLALPFYPELDEKILNFIIKKINNYEE